MPAKILVVGAVCGQLRKAFEKISKLNSKNSFDFAIAVGDLFGSTDEANLDLKALLEGSLKPPLPLYFTVGESGLPEKVVKSIELSDTNEVVDNLVYLGRKAILPTAYGVNIVALGGKLVQNDLTVALGRFEPLYYETEARSLHDAQSVHLLITNQWPEGIVDHSDQPLPEHLRSNDGVRAISDLCMALKPRYHFSSTPAASWEREPFRHPLEYGSLEEEKVTRFRSLASINNTSKEWMAAFNLDPKLPPPASKATRSPFSATKVGSKRRLEGDVERLEPFPRFREGDDHRSPRSHKRQRLGQDDCFMCVNRSDFQTHMLVSIGNESILTVPKGPLPLPSTLPELTWSGHLLIIPTHHAGDDLKRGPRTVEEVRHEFEEMTRYRKALCKMLQSKTRGKLGAVCWDANRTGVRHLHWQFMAVPAGLVKKNLVEAAFKAMRQNHDYEPFQKIDPDSQLGQPADYFRLWIWTPHEHNPDPVKAADEVNSGVGDEGFETSLWFPLRSDQKFNIWFGREVMAKLMKLENRINWKDAQQSEKAEEEDALNLRADFQEFDFAMNGAEA